MLLRIKNLKTLILVFVSASLLILAFPRTDYYLLTWLALVPFFFALDHKSYKESFWIGGFGGLIFFFGTLYWLFNVTRWFYFIAALGITILMCYLALYFALFALVYRYLSRTKLFYRLLMIPAAWVVLEYIRAHLFSGFGWMSLGYSQYKNIGMIQIADILGVYGVSFAIVLANLIIKEIINLIINRQKVFSVWPEILASILVIVSVFLYGNYRLSNDANAIKDKKVREFVIVQPNIRQEDKWNVAEWYRIFDTHLNLTAQARLSNVDLVIWPESFYPGILDEEEGLKDELESFIGAKKINLLFGSVTQNKENIYNSAVLLSREGQELGRYNKIHLVPFGEYLPLRKQIPLLARFVPLGDFNAGQEFTLFKMPNENNPDLFAVLICFEDTVEGLVRKFVLKGAGLLVNLTNDAWFGDTSAPFMHLQSSVFRSVENKRIMIRAANTGVSCFIDELGRIYNSVNISGHNTYVAGTATAKAVFLNEKTFYTKFGDIFTYFCFGCILLIILLDRANVIKIREE